MRIANNLSALFAQNNLQANKTNLSLAVEKLSSNYRINRTSDDDAGLQISSKMRAQIRAYDSPVRNSQDGISMLQVAEHGMNETYSILNRMRELAVHSVYTHTNQEERLSIQEEINQLSIEIDRIANNTTFNNKYLLNGTADFTSLQKGQTKIDNIPTFNITTSALGITKDSATSMSNNGEQISNTGTVNFSQELVDQQGNIKYGIDVTTELGASAAITLINNAISNVLDQRTPIGSLQFKLEHSINNLGTPAENLTASESRIKDIDMAKEMMEFTKNNVLNQTAQAMLAQANQSPHGVLQLLR